MKKKPIYKLGIISIYPLERAQRKALEFWMAVIRTLGFIFTVPAGIYAIIKLLGR